MSFMQPFTYFGAYYAVDTLLESFIVPADLVGSDATADDLATYAPEYVSQAALDQKDEWQIELKQGWYGRMSAPGYMDCTDWETADTEEELLETLREMYGDDSDDDESDDVPNLDAMDSDELRQYADGMADPGTAPSMPDHVRSHLIRYSSLRMTAIAHRLAGRIAAAQEVESRLEATYNVLPESYRW